MNDSIFFFFYNLSNQSPIFDSLVIFFAGPFANLVLVAAIIFMLYHHDVLRSGNQFAEILKKWREVIFVFITSFLAWFAAIVLKLIFSTDRPDVVFSQIFPLFERSDHAFPSGHATFFMALATAIWLKHKKVGWFFLGATLIISVSRVIAGVHFPIDILGGWVIGALIAYLLRNV